MRETSLGKSKKISRKMLKKRQNEVKRKTFLFDEVKKRTNQRILID